MDQGSDLSKKMRFKYSGNEGVFGIMLTGGVHYSSTEENAGWKAGGAESLIQELEDSVAYIDWKQNFYDEVLSGARPYVSNLIRAEEA